ncbi:hypothetical protein [Algiphilus sp.]|uniref:hypothetical protein n=1 Tax=Algiphilus sp. TaxID=1872431 RepID=UPI003B51EBC9
MALLSTAIGCVAGGLACWLWYAAHPNQRLRAQPVARPWRWVGHGLAVCSLVLLAVGLGIGPGLIAGVCLLQFGCMSLPYLSLRGVSG